VEVTASCAERDRADLLPELGSLGLGTAWLPSDTTAAYTFHYDGDRRTMWQEAVAEPWSPQQAVAAVGDADWVHVGALTRSDFPVETLAALADRRKLLVDGQGLVRSPALGPLRRDAGIGAALEHVAILKLDDEEATILAGSLEAEAIRRLGVAEVIVTLGARGSFVVTRDLAEQAAAAPAAEPVDPTGAGDMFSAAYLDARCRGVAPPEAARTAGAFVSMLLTERAAAQA
jgi:sugar/nucleoside kinase (ribokinase family)